MKGKVISWFAKKGYGFILGDDGNNYFCHYTQVPARDNGYQGLRVAEVVHFEPKETQKGKQAEKISFEEF